MNTNRNLHKFSVPLGGGSSCELFVFFSALLLDCSNTLQREVETTERNQRSKKNNSTHKTRLNNSHS